MGIVARIGVAVREKKLLTAAPSPHAQESVDGTFAYITFVYIKNGRARSSPDRQTLCFWINGHPHRVGGVYRRSTIHLGGCSLKRALPTSTEFSSATKGSTLWFNTSSHAA